MILSPKQEGHDGPNRSRDFKSSNPKLRAAELLVPEATI